MQGVTEQGGLQPAEDLSPVRGGGWAEADRRLKPALLVSQRVDGVDPGCLDCRVNSEDDSHGDRYSERDPDRGRGDNRLPLRSPGNHPREEIAKGNAEQPAS